MNRILFLKKLDAMLGPAFISIVARSTAAEASEDVTPGKMLIIRPGGIGDAVLLIPAISFLKQRFPSTKIDILAEKRNADVFSLSTYVENVYRYDKLGEFRSAMRGAYDVVIDTEQWHRLSAVVARLVGARRSLGFATNERGRLFSHTIPYSHEDYEVDSFLHLTETLTGTVSFDAERPFLSVAGRDIARIELHLGKLSMKKIVALFPGSSVAERRWGNNRFHDVAAQLSRRGYGIVVVGGAGDRLEGEKIVNEISGGLNTCGELSLSETAAVLQGSSLLITGDSGIMHLGYAVGTRVVALFGPGIERKWAPKSPRVAVLNKHLPCSPCTKFGYTPRCRRDAACMKGISVDEVVAASVTLLETA